jgi:hypothetical protein
MRLIYILGNKYTCTCHKISDHFTVFFCSTGRGRNESETKIEKRAEGFLERCYTTVTDIYKLNKIDKYDERNYQICSTVVTKIY